MSEAPLDSSVLEVDTGPIVSVDAGAPDAGAAAPAPAAESSDGVAPTPEPADTVVPAEEAKATGNDDGHEPEIDDFFVDRYGYVTSAGFLADARRNFWTVSWVKRRRACALPGSRAAVVRASVMGTLSCGQ